MNPRTALPWIAVLGVLASGCSGSSDSPRSLPSITATPTVSSSAAAIPASARAQTPQGADAFVRFFFEQVNVAFSTSNPDIISSLSDPGCGTCAVYREGLEDSRKRGLRIVGPSFSLLEVAAAPVDAGKVVAEAFGSIPAKKQVDSSGSTIHSIPEQGSFHFTLTLNSAPSGWTVAGIKIDSE